MMEIRKSFTIEAATGCPTSPAGHKCARLHGHRSTSRSPPADDRSHTGWIVDYADIKQAFQPLYGQLDHNTERHRGLENPRASVSRYGLGAIETGAAQSHRGDRARDLHHDRVRGPTLPTSLGYERDPAAHILRDAHRQ